MRNTLIKAQHIKYRYANSEKNALDDLSFEINKGEVIGIIGANGAGKTTLCSAIKGIVPHKFGGAWGGSLEVCGINVRTSSVGELSLHVSMTFQNPESQIIGTTVAEDIAFMPENLGIDPVLIRGEIEQVMETVRLPLSYKKHQPYAMSGGEKQRLAIASAIISTPEIIIFDEPTTELDPVGKYEVLQIVRNLAEKGENTIIVVEQDIEYLITVADRLLVMHDGKLILQGKTREVMAQYDILKEAEINLPDIVKLWHQSDKTDQIFINLDEAARYFKNKGIHFTPRVCGNGVSSDRATECKAVECQNIYFSYTEKQILKGIDFSIDKGEFVAVLGKNGAGKTTLVKHLNSLLRPDSGDVIVCGRNTKECSTAMLASDIAYVFQNPDHQLFAQTVEEEIAFGPRNLGWDESKIKHMVDEAIAFGKLETYRKENPLSLERGLKQILILCSVIAMDVEILVVDEPTTGLGRDYKEIIGSILERLNSMGKTIILVTHDMEFVAEHAKRIIVVNDGKITLDGKTREVFSKPRELRESYIFPPQVTSLALMLGAKGCEVPLNTDEFMEAIK